MQLKRSFKQGGERRMPAYRITLEELDLDAHEFPGVLMSCVDPRFSNADCDFGHDLLWPGQAFDHFKWAGAGINFLKEPNCKILLKQIRDIAVETHHVKEIAVINHWDCAGYGYSRSFASPDAEEARHIEDLRKIRAILQKEFPDRRIIVGYSKPTDQHLEYHLIDDDQGYEKAA